MKIRDQFILTTAIFGLVLIALAVSLFVVDHRIQRIADQQQIADSIEQDARDLSFLSNDYLLYQESPKYSQWETRYLSIYDNLATLSEGTAEQLQTVNNMKSNLQRLKSVFSELNSVVVASPGNQINLDFVQISWSRVEVQNQSLISDGEKLSRSFLAQVNQLNRNYTFLITTVAAVFGAFLIINYFFTARRVLNSIARVRTGAKIIGAGNLDYTLPDMSRNEIGDLSRAFNQMTTDLKQVTASKTELEREIAERQQAEQALIESEERYRGLVELSPEAVVVHRQGEILYANASALKLFGASTFEQLAAHNILEYIDPENREAARQSIHFISEGNTSSMTERKALRLDGQPWIMEAAGSPTYWKGQKCIQVIIRDITERKKAEANIRDLMISVQQEKDRLATLVNSIPDEVWFADNNKNFVLINPSAVADFGLQGVKEIGVEAFARSLEVFRADGTRRTVAESPALRALKGETVTNLEEKIRIPATGELRDRQVSSVPVRDPQGNIVGAVSVVRDITELKKAQQAAEQYALALEDHRNNLEDMVKQRTEELQTLSYRLIMVQEEERRSISRELHDQIGQSLTVLNLLLAKALRSPEPRTDLDAAVQTVKEVLSQVRNLSSSLHPGMLEDLGLVPTLNWYFNDFSKKTDIEIHFHHEGLENELPADVKITIYRVVQEALTNIVRYAAVKEANVSIILDGQRLFIRIEDKGKGFNPEFQSQGVGLRGMRERVNSFNGQLRIISAPGEGTRVEVEILLAQPGP